VSQIILSGDVSLEGGADKNDPRAETPRAKIGDPSANVLEIAEWIEQHGDAVRGYLRAMTGRHDVADDLWQDVFQRVWRAGGRYDERGAARAYLIRIADRLLCDRARQLRRRAVERQLDDEGWRRVEPASGDPAPGRALEATEAGRRLHAALDLLSPAQRRVLLLRYYGELSFAEIAATVERPLNTVLSDCRRGLEALRGVLGGLDAREE
jgi:RNA polymerase sigma-70 factor (ECF subfamily)